MSTFYRKMTTSNEARDSDLDVDDDDGLSWSIITPYLDNNHNKKDRVKYDHKIGTSFILTRLRLIFYVTITDLFCHDEVESLNYFTLLMERYSTDLTLKFGFCFYFPLWLFFNFIISCLALLCLPVCKPEAVGRGIEIRAKVVQEGR